MPGKKRKPVSTDHSQLDLWIKKKNFQWEDFKVAREYIHSMGLTDYAGWEKFVRDGNLKDRKIPKNPERV